MSKKIQGITIEIDGNTSKLEDALKSVNKTLYSVNSELRATEKALKLDPTNTDLLKQKMLLLSKAVQETEDKVKTLKEAQNQMRAKGIDENSEQFRTLTREITKTESSLKDLKSKQDGING
jgi:phage-related minor tail protein